MSKIGIFDSGIGGLTVFKEIVGALPEYDYLYLGDSARAPYGSRKMEEVYHFTEQAVRHLIEEGCSLIVLACNTASAEALRRIQQDFLPSRHPEVKVLGVLVPAVEEVAIRRPKRVGVIATEGTVRSGAYEREIIKLSPQTTVYQSAAPELVPLIESGITDGEKLRDLIVTYTKPLLDNQVEAIILGCTHYALIEDQFRDVLPKDINIINQALIVSDKFSDYLLRHPEVGNRLSKGGSLEYHCSGDPSAFTSQARKLLALEIDNIKKVKLGD